MGRRRRVRRNERPHGMGSVKALPDGRYRAWRPPEPHPEDPSRKVRPSRIFDTRERAEMWLRGADPAVSPPLGDWCERWLARRWARLRPGSRENYRYDLALLGPLALRPLDALTTADLQAAIDGLLDRFARSTVARARTVWSAALSAAVRELLLPTNPMLDTRLPRATETPPKAWTALEVARLLSAAAGGPHEAWLHLALSTGLRMGELRALLWTDVDLRALTVTVSKSMHNKTNRVGPTKSGRVRVVDLPPETAALLVAHRDRQEPATLLVLGRPGRAYNPSSYRKRLRVLCKQAGAKPLPVHSTRHTFASLLLERRVQLPDISRARCHSASLSGSTRHNLPTRSPGSSPASSIRRTVREDTASTSATAAGVSRRPIRRPRPSSRRPTTACRSIRCRRAGWPATVRAEPSSRCP